VLEEYVRRLNCYLPIDFNNYENNEYRQYLIDTYLENCNNGKYQFALIAFHMLFMSFLYKEFWELKTFSYNTVKRICDTNANFERIKEIFDTSIIPELTTIDQYLSVFNWHVNKKNAVKEFVNKRDACAHASGFIQFHRDSSIRYFDDVLEYAEKISLANKQNVINIFLADFESYLGSDKFINSLSGEYITKKVAEIKYSPKDIGYILTSDIPKIISDDEMGDFKIAYYFSMLVLQTYYENNVFQCAPDFDRFRFINELYLFIETLDAEQYEKLQVQIEDELNYLKSLDSPIDLSAIEGIVDQFIE